LSISTLSFIPASRSSTRGGVVSHPGLSFSGKRAILASWASDATAIARCLSLWTPEGLKAPVAIDEILEALCALDGGPRQLHGGVAITGPAFGCLVP
jgi:hypothetical protein